MRKAIRKATAFVVGQSFALLAAGFALAARAQLNADDLGFQYATSTGGLGPVSHPATSIGKAILILVVSPLTLVGAIFMLLMAVAKLRKRRTGWYRRALARVAVLLTVGLWIAISVTSLGSMLDRHDESVLVVVLIMAIFAAVTGMLMGGLSWAFDRISRPRVRRYGFLAVTLAFMTILYLLVGMIHKGINYPDTDSLPYMLIAGLSSAFYFVFVTVAVINLRKSRAKWRGVMEAEKATAAQAVVAGNGDGGLLDKMEEGAVENPASEGTPTEDETQTP